MLDYDDAVGVVHDVSDEHGVIQHLGEAGRLEQDGQIGHAARLLHPAHLPVEFLVLRLLLLLQALDIGLLLGDLEVVLVQQGLAGVDLLLGEHHLALDELHLLLGLAEVVADLGQLGLDLLFLGLDVAEVVLEVLDILLGHVGVGDGGQGGRQQGQQQHRRQHNDDDALSFFLHAGPPLSAGRGQT